MFFMPTLLIDLKLTELMSLCILGYALLFVNTYDYIILDLKKTSDPVLSALHSNKQVCAFIATNPFLIKLLLSYECHIVSKRCIIHITQL